MSEAVHAVQMEAHNKNKVEERTMDSAEAEAVKALQMELADLRKLIRLANRTNSMPKAKRN